MRFLLMAAVVSLVFSVSGLRDARADEPFDSYNTNISWNEERARLENFAIFLKRNPDYVGGVYVFPGKTETVKKARTRIKRIINFLTKEMPSEYRIEGSRIFAVSKESSLKDRVILQPIHKNSSPPDFK